MARINYQLRLVVVVMMLLKSLLLLLQGRGSNACLEEERVALLRLKASFNYTYVDEPYGMFTWRKDVDCCKWDGVVCNATTGRVYELILDDFRSGVSVDSWYFNASMFLPFQELRSLSLSDNSIVCCVKNEGFERFANAINLEYLDLSYNKLGNVVLSSLAGFSSLKTLNMSGIGLKEISGIEELQKLRNLEILHLGDNDLNNNVLLLLRGLHSLKILDISFTQLKGSINMEDLVALFNLEELDVSGNNIDKFFAPKDIKGQSNISIRRLEGVYMGSNFQLESLKAFSNLESLHLENNNFTGVLFPQELNNVKELYLDASSLDVNFLQSLGALRSLRTLSMGSINPNIPTFENIEGQSNISDLWLKDGACNGSSFQPESLKVFPNLESLYLGNNNFTGVSLSKELNNVKELYLDGSSLDVNFLQSLGALRSLRTLSMDSINASQSLFNINTLLQSTVNMTSLETLSLSYSKFTGNIQGLCHFTNLRVLHLSDNNLSGNLSHCLVNLTLLQELDLSNNYFIGKLSHSPLKFLTSITSLTLRDNRFEIPSSLSPFFNHSKLKKFDAPGNEVYIETEVVNSNLAPKFQLESLSLTSTSRGGSFPEFLYHQHDLHDLHISGIPMIGLGFPSWLLENNTKLESLFLSNCSLSGSLDFPARNPNAILSYLDISKNHFYGCIPIEMCAYFPRLESLDLSENEFTGSIPKSLSNCAFLRTLLVRDNKLFDKVPKWIGSMDSLGVLDLSKNMLFGSIPAILETSQLQQIFLSENRLEGPFPDLISLSNNLKVLDLSYNYLFGIIPKWIEKFYMLKYLFLSHNNFVGKIPINLWKMTNELRVVDLSHNKLSILSTNSSNKYTKKIFGGYIYTVGEFELVLKGNIFGFTMPQILDMDFVGLDLSKNNLKGQIPYEFGTIQGINLLNLSYNSLFGPIPFSFSNMSQIETLDLSCNNLSGAIPHQLTELNFLEVFNVSYNNLSGETPNRVAQFATFDESSYEGNPFLCGLPLSKNCTSKTPTLPSSNDDEVDDELVDMNVFYISFYVTFAIILVTMFAILYINPYWQKAWFYFIEKTIDSCYYFFVDKFSLLSKLGIR